MIDAKIDIMINISELASDSQQEIKAFGGRTPIRSEDLEDYDPTDKAETVTIYPKAQMQKQLLLLSAKLLKDMCKDRGFCKGCLFSDETGKCTFNVSPEVWRI